MAFAGAEEEGLIPAFSVAENVALSSLDDFSPWGVPQPGRIGAETRTWMEKLDIRARSARQRAGELSRGNQKKILLARALMQRAQVFLFDEPAAGLDVGAQEKICRLINALALAGRGILIASGSPAGLLEVCDTIAVLREGRLVAQRAAADWSEPAIIQAALGSL